MPADKSLVAAHFLVRPTHPEFTTAALLRLTARLSRIKPLRTAIIFLTLRSGRLSRDIFLRPLPALICPPCPRRSCPVNSALTRLYASTQQRRHPIIRWIVLPSLVVAVCFFVRESFTVSMMGVQQQFPFGPALILVGFFLGLGPGFVMLVLSGITVRLWGTTPGQQYPLAVLANMSLAVPVLCISSWIRTLINNERVQRQALSDFVAIVAHEVRTPLSTITVATENSLYYYNNQLPEESAKNILLAAGRIENVISKAIDADIAEITSFTARYEEINLKPFLEKLIKVTLDPERITLQCPSSPLFATDPYLLGTAISNLLDNAIKYSLDDTDVSLIARQDARHGQKGIAITCENWIDPANTPDASRLFRKYYRLNRVSFQSGMGLGLWFSKLMIDALSGSLEPSINSSRVAFHLWIPCQP